MKECFIVTPIGNGGTPIRREIDGLITNVFEPVLSKFDLTPVAAHHISETGSITRQVVKRLLEADVVIANLTNLNPNVMYELGIRHCTRKPTIVVARDDVTLPFDLSDERTIFYQNDIYGVNELKERLEAVIPSALNDDKPDNPVYRVVETDLIKIPEGISDSEAVLDKRLAQLENQIESISRYVKNNNAPSINKAKKLMNSLDRSQRSYYVGDEEISDFAKYCAKYEIPFEDKQVYKDQSLFTAHPLSPEQLALLDKYALENGIKRI
ncbi:hypothetical protein ACHELZ_004452 [Vibrio vulnificus]